MPINSLLIRVLTAGLPLVLIALIAGSVGYVSKGTQTAPIAPLPPEAERPAGIQGTVQNFSNDQLTITTVEGATMRLSLPGESTIERLMSITQNDLAIGAWVNGGAIQHAQSVLALVGLVLISDPVIQTP